MFTVNILIQLKLSIKEMFNDYNEMVLWKIEKKKNLVSVSQVLKNIK